FDLLRFLNSATTTDLGPSRQCHRSRLHHHVTATPIAPGIRANPSGPLRGSSAIPGGTPGDQDSRPDGWRTERVDDWWKKISKTACPWPSRPAPCVPGSTSGINKTRSIEVCQDIRQYAMMQLWF